MGEKKSENIVESGSKVFEPRSADEESRLKRKRKWELIAGAIGEGASAISNLIFATQGAPMPAIKTSGIGKSGRMSLMDQIKRRHEREDKAYSTSLSAWEKEQEKKRKEAERLANDNDVIEDIHPDFRPKTKNWEKKVYVDTLYDQLRSSLQKNAIEYNTKNNKGTIRWDKQGSKFIPSEESSVLKYMDSFYTEGESGRHMKAELIRQILSGEYKNDELSEEWLNQFRKDAQDDHDNWIDYK